MGPSGEAATNDTRISPHSNGRSGYERLHTRMHRHSPAAGTMHRRTHATYHRCVCSVRPVALSCPCLVRVVCGGVAVVSRSLSSSPAHWERVSRSLTARRGAVTLPAHHAHRHAQRQATRATINHTREEEAQRGREREKKEERIPNVTFMQGCGHVVQETTAKMSSQARPRGASA